MERKTADGSHLLNCILTAASSLITHRKCVQFKFLQFLIDFGDESLRFHRMKVQIKFKNPNSKSLTH